MNTQQIKAAEERLRNLKQLRYMALWGLVGGATCVLTAYVGAVYGGPGLAVLAGAAVAAGLAYLQWSIRRQHAAITVAKVNARLDGEKEPEDVPKAAGAISGVLAGSYFDAHLVNQAAYIAQAAYANQSAAQRQKALATVYNQQGVQP